MRKPKCSKCGKGIVKARGLCAKCYTKARRDSAGTARVGKSAVTREVEFIKNYFTHTNWVHHPGIFRMGGQCYAPDFYDSERNVFIEVAGTKQAYHANKVKYDMMNKYFPGIPFEVRQSTGALIESGETIHWGFQH